MRVRVICDNKPQLAGSLLPEILGSFSGVWRALTLVVLLAMYVGLDGETNRDYELLGQTSLPISITLAYS